MSNPNPSYHILPKPVPRNFVCRIPILPSWFDDQRSENSAALMTLKKQRKPVFSFYQRKCVGLFAHVRFIYFTYIRLIVLYIFAHIPYLHTCRIMINHVDLHDLRYNLSDEKNMEVSEVMGVPSLKKSSKFSFWHVPYVTKTHPALGGSPMT